VLALHGRCRRARPWQTHRQVVTEAEDCVVRAGGAHLGHRQTRPPRELPRDNRAARPASRCTVLTAAHPAALRQSPDKVGPTDGHSLHGQAEGDLRTGADLKPLRVLLVSDRHGALPVEPCELHLMRRLERPRLNRRRRR
jgi:hypothetical protein